MRILPLSHSDPSGIQLLAAPGPAATLYLCFDCETHVLGPFATTGLYTVHEQQRLTTDVSPCRLCLSRVSELAAAYSRVRRRRTRMAVERQAAHVLQSRPVLMSGTVPSPSPRRTPCVHSSSVRSTLMCHSLLSSFAFVCLSCSAFACQIHQPAQLSSKHLGNWSPSAHNVTTHKFGSPGTIRVLRAMLVSNLTECSGWTCFTSDGVPTD